MRVGAVGRAGWRWHTLAQVYNDSHIYTSLDSQTLTSFLCEREGAGEGPEAGCWVTRSKHCARYNGAETASKKNSELAGQEPHSHWL